MILNRAVVRISNLVGGRGLKVNRWSIALSGIFSKTSKCRWAKAPSAPSLTTALLKSSANVLKLDAVGTKEIK